MPTNGSSKRKEPQGFLGEDLIADESRFQPLFTGYVGYEQFVGTFIAAAGEAGLRLFDVASTLDTTTLERRFSASCAPAEWSPPLELWAETRFFWPAEYTALSLYGDEAICDLYHEENVACKHRNRQANLFTELEIEYLLPYEFVLAYYLRFNRVGDVSHNQSRSNDHESMIACDCHSFDPSSRLPNQLNGRCTVMSYYREKYASRCGASRGAF